MSIADNFSSINSRIRQAADRVGREVHEISLVAVSKKQPLEKVKEYCQLCHELGIKPVLGENYVQEYRDKRESLPAPLAAHLIGPLQSNKVNLAVEIFDLIESVHSLSLLEAIDKQARKQKKQFDVLLQVNISKDEAKAGFMPEQFNEQFLKQISNLDALSIQGLMSITRLYSDSEMTRMDFRALKTLSIRFEQVYGRKSVLSMGMSEDFEVAIEEGATHVRIGSALFGAR
jgi:pyridoxal phosphate enzyme (YggS family)